MLFCCNETFLICFFIVDCGECGVSIPEDASFAINAFGKVWHKECFKCAECGDRVFSFAKFYDNGEGRPKCAVCFKKIAPSCGACTKTIDGEFREGFGNSYHIACFKCSGCNKPITGDGGTYFIT